MIFRSCTFCVSVSVLSSPPLPLAAFASTERCHQVRTMSLPLSRNVEHFWYTSSTEVPFESTKQRPLWWAHGSEGLFVSFADINSKSETSTERWFDWDPEVYPLGLTPVHGMVLGITQGLVFNDLPKEGTLSKPCHIISVKRQPVLHR